MSIKSGLSFSQTTQNALQEAANLFRQNKVDDAFHVLHENISLPQTQGKLTKAQADAVYRSMIPDPLSAPETPFSKRSCIPAIALRGHALKDLVAHYNLPIGEERSAILKAAAILETEGDEEKAWKILNKALIPYQSNESLIKEVHRIMIDSLRTPTSSFLQIHVKEHPAILEDNFLRANTLECLSSHFFDKEVVEGSKIQLDSPILEFRTKTRSALQLAAQLFRESKKEEAQELLKSAILIPYERGELTKAQVDVVYKTLEDPYHPQTEFAKRQFRSLLMLRAQALKDLVAFYSKIPDALVSWRDELSDPYAKNVILKAMSLLEQGDMERALKTLNDVLPILLQEKAPGITEEIVNEVYHIMNDSLSAPTSTFLRKRIQENPSLIDENRLRAKALESLSSHIFDDEVIKGEAPQSKVFAGTEKAILEKDLAHLALPYLGTKELVSFSRTNKSSKETVVKSLHSRSEVSWKDLADWRRMGITLDKDMLSSVRVIKCDGGQKVDEADLKHILSLCGEHVEVLDFGGQSFNRDFLSLVGKYCPNLLSMKASNSDKEITVVNMRDFAKRCPKLQHLILTNCQLRPGSLKPIAQLCLDLRSIDISGNGKWLFDSDVEDLASGCKLLTDVAAEGISLGDRTLRALAQCPLLRSLKLSQCYDNDGMGRFSAAGMKVFVNGCQALAELSLKSCGIKNDVLCVIGEAGLPLTKINISGNTSWRDRENVTSAGIISLLPGASQVRELTLSSNDLEDDAMEAIAERCPLVTKLVISDNKKISPDGVQAVASKCIHLNHLEMEDFEGFEYTAQAGYLQALTDGACRLTSIDFNSNPNTTAAEMIAFVRKYTDLRHIQLPDRQITDEVLFAIAASCPNLESLDCSGDNGVTALGIAAIGRGCPHFKYLKATHRKIADDEFLKALGQNFPELTHLDISNGHTESGDILYGREGFIALGKGCRKLSELRISHCNIDSNILGVISGSCSSLKRIVCADFTFHDNEIGILLNLPWKNLFDKAGLQEGFYKE